MSTVFFLSVECLRFRCEACLLPWLRIRELWVPIAPGWPHFVHFHAHLTTLITGFRGRKDNGACGPIHRDNKVPRIRAWRWSMAGVRSKCSGSPLTWRGWHRCLVSWCQKLNYLTVVIQLCVRTERILLYVKKREWKQKLDGGKHWWLPDDLDAFCVCKSHDVLDTVGQEGG